MNKVRRIEFVSIIEFAAADGGDLVEARERTRRISFRFGRGMYQLRITRIVMSVSRPAMREVGLRAQMPSQRVGPCLGRYCAAWRE